MQNLYIFTIFESYALTFETFILQYVASASGEIYNLLTGNSQLTFAAIIKLIDEDFFPRENAEWAKNATAKAKQFLAVIIAERKLDIQKA